MSRAPHNVYAKALGISHEHRRHFHITDRQLRAAISPHAPQLRHALVATSLRYLPRLATLAPPAPRASAITTRRSFGSVLSPTTSCGSAMPTTPSSASSPTLAPYPPPSKAPSPGLPMPPSTRRQGMTTPQAPQGRHRLPWRPPLTSSTQRRSPPFCTYYAPPPLTQRRTAPTIVAGGAPMRPALCGESPPHASATHRWRAPAWLSAYTSTCPIYLHHHYTLPSRPSSLTPQGSMPDHATTPPPTNDLCRGHHQRRARLAPQSHSTRIFPKTSSCVPNPRTLTHARCPGAISRPPFIDDDR